MNFNPRTHVGCDVDAVRFIFSMYYFNPRTHVGCEFGWASCRDRVWILVAAASVRKNMRSKTNIIRLVDFNPRTHVGCDTVKI